MSDGTDFFDLVQLFNSLDEVTGDLVVNLLEFIEEFDILFWFVEALVSPGPVEWEHGAPVGIARPVVALVVVVKSIPIRSYPSEVRSLVSHLQPVCVPINKIVAHSFEADRVVLGAYKVQVLRVLPHHLVRVVVSARWIYSLLCTEFVHILQFDLVEIIGVCIFILLFQGWRELHLVTWRYHQHIVGWRSVILSPDLVLDLPVGRGQVGLQLVLPTRRYGLIVFLFKEILWDALQWRHDICPLLLHVMPLPILFVGHRLRRVVSLSSLVHDVVPNNLLVESNWKPWQLFLIVNYLVKSLPLLLCILLGFMSFAFLINRHSLFGIWWKYRRLRSFDGVGGTSLFLECCLLRSLLWINIQLRGTQLRLLLFCLDGFLIYCACDGGHIIQICGVLNLEMAHRNITLVQPLEVLWRQSHVEYIADLDLLLSWEFCS